ncbi:Retrovirus-related Pol polyprotein from transposon TNT 1-94 [Sesamum angolense]|uniref:Retrovirus-related Pol polyprotein from transposon TNT 1-94 n=1 Tax=Sesamum angolense TaxID=2727404 RepID=A0AAE1W7H1_9LAMI|nr:Retrovirus-related Pol polyprotein from transposon TNT 1-94 [Sesamum angolense]
MKGILIQQKVFKAIDGKYAENVSDDKKLENDEYAYSSIILNLSDTVIRKVGKQNSAKELWNKLEELYTETSLPKTYGDVKAAIKYGRDNVNLETVVSGLKSKEIDLKTNQSSQSQGELIDSGCTYHMTPFREILSNYRYVPDLAHNLISCSALEEEGLEGKWYDCFAAPVLHTNKIDLWHKSFLHYVKLVASKDTELLLTPQQNGVAERMNRTLLNKVRCLLISSGLAKSFWGEALLTAAYLINRSPSVPLLGKLPECVWTGKNVDLSYLRIFGCSAFVFQNSDKLEPRALKCVFIGYPEGIKGYRLWLRCQPGFKVVISKDVTFNESEMPCLENSSKRDLDFQIEGTEKGVNPGSLLVLYVDDMLIASPSITLITELQKNLCKNFEMKDLGNAKRILGMTIDRDRKNSVIFLNQKTYVKTVLEKFSMENAKTTPVPLAAHFQLSKEQSPKTESETEHMKSVPYSNAIGSVMYLMVSTRPDIAYAVSCLSRYMSNAGLPHWEALKWLLRYLKGSINTEAEYIATTEAFKEAMWLEAFVAGLRGSVLKQPLWLALCGLLRL